jgi:hypothetical protein
MASDWQIIFNGLTIGGGGTRFGLIEIVGLHDTPPVRMSNRDRARAHGQYAGTTYLSGRPLVATCEVMAPHPNNAVWDAFSSALVPGGAEMEWQAQIPGVAGGRLIQLLAQVTGLRMPQGRDYMFGKGVASVEWWATDPLIYDAEETSLATTMASLAGTGFTFPLTFPLSFGGPVSGGIITATNEGEYPAPWSATIAGPVTDPRIENVTTGQTIGFVGSLAAGEELVIDSKERSVLLDGVASRYSWLTSGSEWFALAPGDNQIRLAGAAGAGSLTLSFRSTWV